jgi:hypothetical protein
MSSRVDVEHRGTEMQQKSEWALEPRIERAEIFVGLEYVGEVLVRLEKEPDLLTRVQATRHCAFERIRLKTNTSSNIRDGWPT